MKKCQISMAETKTVQTTHVFQSFQYILVRRISDNRKTYCPKFIHYWTEFLD